MTKKEISRKVWLVLSFGWFFYITIKFLMGKADIFSTICMFVCYSYLALILILNIVLKILQYKTYKFLVNEFEYLQAVHDARYKLYFTGDREKVEEYSAEIERFGNVLLDVCKTAISSNLLSKKRIKNVEEIINQTKKLMITTN